MIGRTLVFGVRAARKRVAFGAFLAVVVAVGQGAPAFGARSPESSVSPGRARSIAVAQSGVASAGHALGLGSGQALVVRDVITDADGSTHVRYDRTFDGLRVIGGDLVSHRDKGGRIKAVSWNGARQVGVASTTPKLSFATAKADGTRRGSRVQARSTAATTGELVVYAGGSSGKPIPRLAYDVLTIGVRADQTPSRQHTIVDANTGATLASWDEIENVTGSGKSLYSGTVAIDTTGAPGAYSMRDAVGNYTTNLSGATSGTGTTFTDGDNIWGSGLNTDASSAGVDAQYGAAMTFDFYRNVLGRDGIWNTGVGAPSRVHYGDGYVNAFWDGTQMTYGDGVNNAKPLVELDVAAHEMSHGVTEQTAALAGTGEAAGLNEATSDIFGTSVEWYAHNPVDVPDYLIGEKIDLNGNGTPLRYMDRPSRDGQSPDCWSSTVGNLDPHYSSGPLNHWFYLASEGSGARTLNGVAYSSPTCNASTVAAIGRDAATKIWYRTLTTYLTSGSTYAAARDGAIQSAKDLYGDMSTQCAGIESSFSAIAVPQGAVTCAATPHPGAGSDLLNNPGFESGDTLWAATPYIIDQWGSTVPPQPAHLGTWSAWMGGYGSAHIDSISQVLTIPAADSAALSYYVHIDTDEAPTSAFDTMTVRVGSTVLQTLSNLDAAAGYRQQTVDLSAYVGQAVALSFTGVEDAAVSTSFVVDDTSITTWSSPTAPDAPTGVTATADDAQAAVSWIAPASNGGSAITGYTVTSFPGGRTATTAGPAPATTATVTGLTNGTAYTYRVTATNATETSPSSFASLPVTPRTVPGPPTAVTARAGNASAVVNWTAPASNGGFPITGYTVTASPGGRTATTTNATSATVTGLTNGTHYAFQVLATSAVGPGPYSAMSNSVTPVAPVVTAPVTRLSDFNRDGFTDLVARDSAGLLWLYPGNGAGSFKARHQMGSGWNIMTALITPGDVTGDGIADVLARTAAGALWLYPGNGAGGLGAKRQIGSGWQGFTVTSAGDMTGDGRADVLARDSSGNLWVYPLAGNAVFQARRLNSSGWASMTAITGPGDVSGDRRADILGRDAGGLLMLCRGNGTGGLIGGVSARTVVSAGWTGMTALVTPGNWDRAGGNDLLARNAAGVLWLYAGNNAGGLAAPRSIGSGWNGMTYIG